MKHIEFLKKMSKSLDPTLCTIDAELFNPDPYETF
jgi:hypothetical protein